MRELHRTVSARKPQFLPLYPVENVWRLNITMHIVSTEASKFDKCESDMYIHNPWKDEQFIHNHWKDIII